MIKGVDINHYLKMLISHVCSPQFLKFINNIKLFYYI